MSFEHINQVFHPERPVLKRGLLFGRSKEVATVVNHLETSGGHVLLCGHRGIGKTSIARVAESVLRENFSAARRAVDPANRISTSTRGRDSEIVARYITCDHRVTFDSIAGMILSDAKIGNVATDSISPSFLATLLSSVEGFALIDEAERLSSQDRVLIAELMKCLSDNSATFSICVVGVARTAIELFHQHPSIQRCLNEIPVRPLGRKDSQKLIEEGFASLGLIIRPDTVLDIVRLARGFPAYVVALCSSLAQYVLSNGRPEAKPDELRLALRDYLEGNGAGAYAVYKRAIAFDSNGVRRKLLLASSLVDDDEFTLEAIMAQLQGRYDLSADQSEEIIYDLSIDGPAKIFDIVIPRLYMFNNPRMPMIVQAVAYVEKLQ